MTTTTTTTTATTTDTSSSSSSTTTTTTNTTTTNNSNNTNSNHSHNNNNNNVHAPGDHVRGDLDGQEAVQQVDPPLLCIEIQFFIFILWCLCIYIVRLFYCVHLPFLCLATII